MKLRWKNLIFEWELKWRQGWKLAYKQWIDLNSWFSMKWKEMERIEKINFIHLRTPNEFCCILVLFRSTFFRKMQDFSKVDPYLMFFNPLTQHLLGVINSMPMKRSKKINNCSQQRVDNMPAPIAAIWTINFVGQAHYLPAIR
jgi:hypothetical protein